MKLHRFFISEPLARGRGTLRDHDIAHQLHSVLRKQAGDIITLCDHSGKAAHVIIRSIKGDALEYEVVEQQDASAANGAGIYLYCAILKHDHFELVAEKATELGIARLIPIITERTIKTGIKNERIKKIMKEAAEQSERTNIPTLSDPMYFSDAVDQALANCGAVFFCDTKTNGAKQKKSPQGNASTALFIGPEGGWTDAEREIANKNKFLLLSLGDRPMRAETAAIVGVYELKNRH